MAKFDCSCFLTKFLAWIYWIAGIDGSRDLIGRSFGVSDVVTAAAAVCVSGGRLTEADWQRCLTEMTEVTEVTELMEMTEVTEVTAAVTVCPLPLLLSVSVETE